MDPVNPDDLRADLHRLVDRLFDAPPAELKAALARLVRVARLSAQMRAYQAGRAMFVSEPALPPAEPEAAPAAPVLEGRFVRLLAGGKLLLPDGEHPISEEAAISARLQHGDLVIATPDEEAGYIYKAVSGPVVDQAAVHTWGHVKPLDEDLAVVRSTQDVDVTVAWHDMKSFGATLDDVLKVAYLPESGPCKRHLGRILQVHRVMAEPADTQQPPAERKGRRRATGPLPGARQTEGPRPQFLPRGNRRPRVVIIGGHPPSRVKFAEIIADYGADLHWLPYSPKVKKVRHAVQKCDIVIGMTHCCRTGHWDSAKESCRTYDKLLFCGDSENEKGLRRQLEEDIIPKWNERSAAMAGTTPPGP